MESARCRRKEQKAEEFLILICTTGLFPALITARLPNQQPGGTPWQCRG